MRLQLWGLTALLGCPSGSIELPSPTQPEVSDEDTVDTEGRCDDGDGDGYLPLDCGGVDCDDDDDGIHPGAVDLCSGVDEDCDGMDGVLGALDLAGSAWLTAEEHPDLMLEGLGSWTVEMWVYIDGDAIEYSSEYPLFDKKPYYGASSRYTAYSAFLHEGDLLWGTGVSTDPCAWLFVEMAEFDRWVHLALVLNADAENVGTKQVYVDGEQVADCRYGVRASETGGQDLWVGSGTHSSHEVLPGAIDAMRISSVDRYGSADFIPATCPEADDDTLALWLFDEGAGETVYDTSGNGHHLSLAGDGENWLEDGAGAP